MPRSIVFTDDHIEQIKNGDKTQTRRDWKDNFCRPTEGDVMAITTGLFVPNDEASGFIRLTEDVRKQRLGDMTDEEARREGDYESVEEFKKAWIDINGEWDPDNEVDVVTFQYMGENEPKNAEYGERLADMM